MNVKSKIMLGLMIAGVITTNVYAKGINSTELGNGAHSQGHNSIAIGAKSKASANESNAVGERAEATAQNSSAFGSDAKASGMSALAVGTGSRATADTAVALGNDSVTTAKSAVALGGSAKATHNFGVALGDSSETKQQTIVKSASVNGINYSNFAGTDGSGAVSVGKSNFSRQIQHVGAGEISKTSTDAINGSQLYAVAEQVGNNASQINANRAKIAKLSNTVANVNKRIDFLFDDVAKNRKRAAAGNANAVAVANIPHATYAGRSALGVGLGVYQGQQAVAVRYSRMSDSTKVIFSGSIGVDTQHGVSAGLGITRQW